MKKLIITLLAIALIIPSIAMAEDETLAKALVTNGVITGIDWAGKFTAFRKVVDSDGAPILKDGEEQWDVRKGCVYTGTSDGLSALQCEESVIFKESAVPAQLIQAFEYVDGRIDNMKKTSIGLSTE